MGFPSGGGSGSTVTQASAKSDNSGDFVTNSASQVDVGLGTSMSIAAAVGDHLLVSISGTWENAATTNQSVIRMLTTTGSNVPVSVTVVAAVATKFQSFSATAIYLVVAGDISGGNVALKMQASSDGVNNLTLRNSGGSPLLMTVVNLH